jgi:hypothetical protein
MFDKDVTLKAIEAFERLMSRLNSKRLMVLFLYLIFLGLVQQERAQELGTLFTTLVLLLFMKNPKGDELAKFDNPTQSGDNKP